MRWNDVVGRRVALQGGETVQRQPSEEVSDQSVCTGRPRVMQLFQGRRSLVDVSTIAIFVH